MPTEAEQKTSPEAAANGASQTSAMRSASSKASSSEERGAQGQAPEATHRGLAVRALALGRSAFLVAAAAIATRIPSARGAAQPMVVADDAVPDPARP